MLSPSHCLTLICTSLYAASALAGEQVSTPVADPLDRPAMMSSRADTSVLLAVARAGRRLVACGERGLILLSDDGGKQWRQAMRVPVAVTLTALQFVSEQSGWVIGHSGVVLHTSDGGENWVRQLDGKAEAQLALTQAKALGGETGMNAVKAAERLVEDGADKPFLDLSFQSDGSGFVVGAYGQIFHTSDAGKTWATWLDRINNPKGLHLNAIKQVGAAIYLAGERGLLLRSLDGGQTFTPLASPYQGSFFTITQTIANGVLIGGLRGNAFHSIDQGASWEKVEMPSPITLINATKLDDGRTLLLNQSGQVFISSDGKSWARLTLPALPTLTALAVSAQQELVVTSFRGNKQIPLKFPSIN